MPDESKTQVLNNTNQYKAETFLPSAFSAAQLRFENWGYRHASRKAFAVRGLNLTIEAGQRVLLLGASGIGKSTILEGAAGLIGSDIILKSDSNDKNSNSSSHNVLVEDEDGGVSEGAVFVDDVPVHKARGRVGLVLQDPESQAIFQRLGDNVAFGPENMNVPRKEIWNIVDESLKEVGLDGLQLHRSTAHLSGGQMQRLALAGALAMKPSVLLLDEPTANLDPDGVEQIVSAVGKVLDDTHATMVLVEHHAQPWIDLIDRVIVLGLENSGNSKNGEDSKNFVHDDDIARDESAKTVIVADGTPDEVFNRKDLDFENLGIWLPDKYKDSKNRNIGRIHVEGEPDCDPSVGDGKVVLSTKNLAISHTDTPIAKNINLEFNSGQITALVGANGAGKSTLSLTLAGLIPSIEGEVVASEELCKDLDSSDPIKWKSTELAKRISYVFQNPEHQFACGTVLEEVMLGPIRTGMSEEDARSKAKELLERFRLGRYANANPYTLSGGEKRRLTVAASLAAAPRVLILDEPTFGQDRKTWMQIIKLIASLRADGVSVIVVTHDKELVDALGARLVELLPISEQTSEPTSEHTSEHKNSDSDDLTRAGESQAKEDLESSQSLSSTTNATNISRIKVSAVNKRDEKERAASCSPFLASLNPVYRMLGAFMLSIPLLFTLDWLSSTIALVLEFIILWIVGMNPWRVVKLSWPVWVGAPGSALAVWLYGKSGGATLFDWGIIHVSEHSTTLAIATFIRILAIGVPAIVTVIGIDATDLADAFSQVMHLPDKFVYGGLAGMRLFSVLQDDWAALSASRRSRGLGDDSKIRAFMPQAFALLVLSIRRSSTLATAMQARGFGGENPRSHARISHVNKRDYVFMVVCLIIPAIALIASVYYGTFALLGGN
ncbi:MULTISPECIES: ATP-binding cassette domain-containing protein [Gardnerella]|uniref:Cobalt transport protein n=1 Tax=Gardnerella pickettii JCP8017A TaxID=1261062 RepID=T2PK05_9BIFI|nr:MULTISPECIES: ATP-binding cassette domain-containing protein [Gardnerella]EPI51840.1 cobalt transport protein [Gardnerella pickettii JCP8017A]EPI61681.1 cobalt transport protein [Gardnerella pickettii JCP8017B]NSX26597.1 ATP-binding cassette domain-containing protein [Gardnerella vaginalis]PKZ39604.1 ABC transporter ATP-binding protein [Gardnerella pickettii]